MPREKTIELLLFSASLTALFILAGIFIFLFTSGINAFSEISLWQFLLGTEWNPTSYSSPKWGMLSLFAGTLILAVGSLIFSVPLGIVSAIYLAEIAPNKIKEIIKPTIEMLAGIPSVILGLIGLLFFAPLIAKIFHLNIGLNALTASIIVGVMALPTIVSLSEDVITSLPKDFREASFSLGATKWQTIKMVLLPASLSGIMAAVMLGLGRIIGETMVVLMIAGNSIAFPLSFFDPIRPITANIAIEINEVVKGSLHYHALLAMGFVLFAMTFVINFISDIIIEKQATKYKW